MPACWPPPAATPREGLAVEPAASEPQEALGHEDHHGDENDAHRDQIELGEKARERLAQQQKRGSTDDRPDQGADAAHDVENHGFAGNQEEYEIGRGEAVL